MKRYLVLIALALATVFAFANPAGAVTLTGGPFSRPWQQWADASQMPAVSVPVAFTEFSGDGPCGGAAGCTDWLAGPSGNEEFRVAITRQADSASTLRHYLWHELTHVFDGAVMSNYYRARFMAAWGLPGGPDAWWAILPGTGGGSAGEWFAEAGAICDKYGVNVVRAGLPRVGDWVGYAFPGWRHMAALALSCRIIAAAGRAAGLLVPAQRSYPPVRPVRVVRHGSSGTVTGRG